MKWFSFFTFILFSFTVQSQSDTTITMEAKTCCPDGKYYSNIVAVGGKYIFSSMTKTRNTLSDNGFILNEEAIEYQLRFYNLPKLYYFQQLGTLNASNYASVIGLGLKEDFRLPLLKDKVVELTPYIEVGGGYYMLNIIKGVSHNSMSTVLDSQIENYFMDNFTATADIGLDLGFTFHIGSSKIGIVANGGYILNYPTEWRLAGSLAFSDKMDISSPYVGFTVKLEKPCCN
ncbi:MAG: hypothetical protein R2774_09160 [Saprospiraceae bacterium]